MSDEDDFLVYGLDSPLHCVIKVRGHIRESWGVCLHMRIANQTTERGIPISILTGELTDQSVLLGVINGLYGFGFALISVKCVPCSATNYQSDT